MDWHLPATGDRRVGGRATWWPAVALVAAAVLCYSSSFGGAFVFDDEPNILDNRSVRRLSSLVDVLGGAATNTGIAGRPVVNLSLAMNFAVSDYRAWSYHAVNLAIHALAGLTLYGVARRTLHTAALAERWGGFATQIAFSIALLWLVHPLNTQAVTYVIQRAESLMGLFLLVTLYCAIRGWQAPTATPWHVGAVVACLIGAGSKEVIVAAPPLVLLWEVVFLGRGPVEAARRSRWLYAGLALCLVAVAALVASGGTARSIPQSTAGSWWPSILTQAQVVLHYLELSIWPATLCLDYWWPVASPVAALPSAILVASLIGLTALGVLRRNPIGWLGAWLFGILAVTSLAPLPDAAFEHRMYLPLAAVVALVVIGVIQAGGRLSGQGAPGWLSSRHGLVVAIGLVVVVTGGLGARTWRRNLDYHDPLMLWRQTAMARPSNPRAITNFANQLKLRGKVRDAVALYRRAIRVEPDYALAHRNLAFALEELGDVDGAVREHREAIRLHAGDAGWYNDLGLLLASLGREEEAIPIYLEAIRRRPQRSESATLHFNLGAAYQRLGRHAEARVEFRRALELDPDHQPSLDRLAQPKVASGASDS